VELIVGDPVDTKDLLKPISAKSEVERRKIITDKVTRVFLKAASAHHTQMHLLFKVQEKLFELGRGIRSRED